jgi:hypothetical protein
MLNPLADAERRQDAAEPVDAPVAVERVRGGQPTNGSGKLRERGDRSL